MQKKLSDFQSALLQTVLDDYADIPEEAQIELELSPQLQAKAKELIHHPGRYSHRLTLRRILIIAAILSILATTALAIPSVREAIVDFFLVEHSGSYGITFDPAEAETTPREIVEVYGPTYTNICLSWQLASTEGQGAGKDRGTQPPSFHQG